jgi:hypothetical protein
MIAAYRDAGGRGKLILQLHLSYDPDPDRALALAFEEWHTGVVTPPESWDLDTPEAFERASASATPDDVAKSVRVSSDLGQHGAWIAEYADLGFDDIYLHHVGQEQRGFLDAFGEHVLPQLDIEQPAPAVAV